MIVRAVALIMLLIAPNVPEPPRDPGTLARTILSDSSRYHLTQPHVRERPKNWLERAWSWVALEWSRLLGLLLRNVRVSGKASTGLGAVLLFLLAMGVVVAIVKALAVLMRGSEKRVPEAFATRSEDVRELYERSADAAARRSFTLAIQLLFAASVAALVARGVTRHGRSATVGDLRREVRSADASLVAAFDAVAAPFTSAVYAELPPGESDWVRARAAFFGLWSEADAA